MTFGVSGVDGYADLIRSGQLRTLAVTSDQRQPNFAEIPTLQEADVGVVYVNWRGIVAPPGLDPDDVQALQAAVTDLHASAEWRNALTRLLSSSGGLVGCRLLTCGLFVGVAELGH